MKKRILYLECLSGIAGDMTVAALLDLGADETVLRQALASLQLDGYEISIQRKKAAGIDVCDFDVILHEHEHEHEAEHDHHHHHHHEHRGLREIDAIIDGGALSDKTKALAHRIFAIVADAEAKAHGVPREEVHFHEVGAVDSIVDVVAAAVCFESLGIDEVVVSPLHEGSGHVMCQHGLLPVPVPAVANIVAACRLPLVATEVKGEMVTPTGAAIAAALRTAAELPPVYTIERIGYGAGKRDFGRPNFLRAMLLEAPVRPGFHDEITVLETNLDDATGEELGLALETLMAAGARDVHYLPCVMKKNRPGWLLRVLCDESAAPGLEEIIFTTTPAIGLRRSKVERTILERETVSIPLPGGDAAVKISTCGDRKFCRPEYESIKQLSAATGIPFRELYHAAKQAAEEI